MKPMRLVRLFAAITALAALFAAPAAGEPFRTAQVETELHAARAAIAPGERFTLVLRQTLADGWHTYWRNPGSSGEPTEVVAWHLPAGATAGDIQWPAPQPIPFDILVNYGYEHEVLYPITLTAPASLRPGQTFALSVDLSWLVCSEGAGAVCLPQEGTLQLALPVAAAGRDDPTWAPRVAAAVAALPGRAPNEARIARGEPGRLSVALPNATAIRNPYFFPYSRDALQPAAPEHARVGPQGLSFSLTSGVDHNLGQTPLEGVVAYEIQSGGRWTRHAVEIAAQPGDPILGTDVAAAAFSSDFPLTSSAPAAPPSTPALDLAGLLVAAGLAFLGGLILNIMPCVLPVLSVKALAFAGGAHAGRAKRDGLLYLAGVLMTFLGLAALLITLRGAGEAVGWGFQLQTPWVTAGLALLFFVIGLNLAGAFEIGGGVQDVGGALARRGGDAGAFFTGALAVIAATPCTAPFMAGAIGAALTQSAGATLAIFTALALGFALPLTALHFSPGLLRAMPKPGPWMERAKNVLAFPMFATAAWLAWVLTEQSGAGGVFALLGLATAIAFFVFVGRWGRIWFAVGLVVLAVTAAITWPPLNGVHAENTPVEEAWSAERLAALRAENKGVFVNFTAAWCVTCKVNEVSALSHQRVRTAFRQHDITYLVGDWTNRDAAIAAALAEHGRAGVPLYLYYPPGGGEPLVLPQILSEDLVLQAIGEHP
jgi:thiol:disulfide interchange protein DsbD